MTIQSRQSELGYTIVEILVAVGLFSFLALLISVVSLGFLKNAKGTSLKMTRDQIVNQLINTSVNQRAILNSLNRPENSAFFNCVCGKNTCTNMLKPYLPFTLYDSAGSIQSPMFYDDYGSPCDSTNPRCRIKVTTSFFAQCMPDLTSTNQNPPPTCDGVPAEFVAIIYTVEENPNIPVTDQKSVALRKITGPSYIQVSDLPAGACPP
ncbi:MAG: type II secretion system protein [Bdellovibrio sp.]